MTVNAHHQYDLMFVCDGRDSAKAACSEREHAYCYLTGAEVIDKLFACLPSRISFVAEGSFAVLS